MKQIFPLKADLTIPLDEYKSVTFSAAKCGLSYRITELDHLNKRMKMSLLVVDKETGATVEELTSAEFTEAGMEKILNEDEYKAYLDAKEAIEQRIVELDDLIQQKRDELAGAAEDEKAAIEEALEALLEERTSKAKEKEKLPVVTPEKIIVNSYDQVAGYVNGGGTLTQEGVAWGLEIEFKGKPLKNIVKT